MCMLRSICRAKSPSQTTYRSVHTLISQDLPRFCINDEYECRLVNESDHEAVIELCANIYGGNDFVPASFHRYIDKPSTLFFGVEYLPKSKIVATRITTIIDGGITGLGIGARMHPKHRGKTIFSQFRNWNNDMIKLYYPNVNRILGTTYSSNKRSLHVQKKEGQIPIQNFPSFRWTEIVNPIKNGIIYRQGYIKTSQQMTDLLMEVEGLKGYRQFVTNCRVINSADLVIDTLRTEGRKRTLFMDTKVFDLSIGELSVKDAKKYLKEEIDCKRLSVWIDRDETTMGMVYIDERPKLTQIYICGAIDHGLEAMMMTNMLFEKYKAVRNLWLFIDDELCHDNAIHELSMSFDHIIVTELKL